MSERRKPKPRRDMGEAFAQAVQTHGMLKAEDMLKVTIRLVRNDAGLFYHAFVLVDETFESSEGNECLPAGAGTALANVFREAMPDLLPKLQAAFDASKETG